MTASPPDLVRPVRRFAMRTMTRAFGVVIAAVLIGAGAPASLATAAAPTPTAIDLGTLGGTFSIANAVNARGQVVGNSTTAGDAAGHAFSWTRRAGWSTSARSAAPPAAPLR